ncbi:MAG TPA: hypothetical protein VJ625_17905 [Propionibacteriaceae bacterium]|nr:hypothetical protein [Propionibacteriaceae bacterium]
MKSPDAASERRSGIPVREVHPLRPRADFDVFAEVQKPLPGTDPTRSGELV